MEEKKINIILQRNETLEDESLKRELVFIVKDLYDSCIASNESIIPKLSRLSKGTEAKLLLKIYFFYSLRQGNREKRAKKDRAFTPDRSYIFAPEKEVAERNALQEMPRFL